MKKLKCKTFCFFKSNFQQNPFVYFLIFDRWNWWRRTNNCFYTFAGAILFNTSLLNWNVKAQRGSSEHMFVLYLRVRGLNFFLSGYFYIADLFFISIILKYKYRLFLSFHDVPLLGRRKASLPVFVVETKMTRL